MHLRRAIRTAYNCQMVSTGTEELFDGCPEHRIL